MPTAQFHELVNRTFALLEQHGICQKELRYLTRPFVEHWVRRGKLPEEIIHIATGRRPDAHLGGTDA